MPRLYKQACKYCQNYYEGHGKTYCSKSCRAKDLGVGNIVKAGKWVECLICQKKIWRKPYLLKKFKASVCSRKCNWEYKRKHVDYTGITGKNHRGWKGDSVSYFVLHKWVRRHLGGAKTCSKCQSEKNVQWANKSHEYKRDLSDWLQLCVPCHKKYDSGIYNGVATRKYDL